MLQIVTEFFTKFDQILLLVLNSLELCHYILCKNIHTGMQFRNGNEMWGEAMVAMAKVKIEDYYVLSPVGVLYVFNVLSTQRILLKRVSEMWESNTFSIFHAFLEYKHR